MWVRLLPDRPALVRDPATGTCKNRMEEEENPVYAVASELMYCSAENMFAVAVGF
jgi:hypothetical protein